VLDTIATSVAPSDRISRDRAGLTGPDLEDTSVWFGHRPDRYRSLKPFGPVISGRWRLEWALVGPLIIADFKAVTISHYRVLMSFR
jgi:hypothetical protein